MALDQLLPIGPRAGAIHYPLFKYTQQYAATFRSALVNPWFLVVFVLLDL